MSDKLANWFICFGVFIMVMSFIYSILVLPDHFRGGVYRSFLDNQSTNQYYKTRYDVLYERYMNFQARIEEVENGMSYLQNNYDSYKK